MRTPTRGMDARAPYNTLRTLKDARGWRTVARVRLNLTPAQATEVGTREEAFSRIWWSAPAVFR